MGAIPYTATWRDLLRPAARDDLLSHRPYPSTAALCAELARFVYLGRTGQIDPAVLKQHLNGLLKLRAVADVASSQAFVVENDEVVIVTFRGTETDDHRDLLIDASLWRRPWQVNGTNWGSVHHGFTTALRAILPDLRRSLATTSKRLVLTGHSLGAAMAVLAATIVEPAALYTFGQPRVGDRRFAESLSRTVSGGLVYERYIGCCDIVTRVPPRLLGFCHAGQVMYVDHRGDVQVEPSPQAVAADRSRARRDYRRKYARGKGNVPLRALADHAPLNYVSGLIGRAHSH